MDDDIIEGNEEQSERDKLWAEIEADRAATRGADAPAVEAANDHDEDADPAPALEQEPAKVEAKPADKPAEKAKEEPALTDEQLVMAELRERDRIAQSKLGNFQRDNAALKARLAELERAVSAPKPAAAAPAEVDPEEWKQLKAEYPDIAASVDAKLKTLQGGAFTREAAMEVIQEGIKTYQARVDERIQAAEKAAADRVTDSLVAFHHPNWVDDVNSADFKVWYDKQDKAIQDLAASSNPRDAVTLLDHFHGVAPASNPARDATTPAPKPTSDHRAQQRARLAAAVTPRNTSQSGSYRPAKRDEDMTPDELWADIERQREAKRGRARLQ